MKDPKALFPILFASSWLGNLLLTILAFYLAFTHDGTLTPLVFLTVAICILSGNALPIVTYWIMTQSRAAELKAESTEATLHVRSALARSEEVIARLDEAEGALAKSILVARQVPDLIKTRFEQMDLLTQKLESLELTNFTDALQTQSASVSGLVEPVGEMKAAIEALGSGLQNIRKEVKGVPGALEKVMEHVSSTGSPGAGDEMDVSCVERLDLVFETLEGVQDSLDGLLQRMAELKQSPVAVPVVEEAVEPESHDEAADDPVAVIPEMAESSDPDKEEDSPQPATEDSVIPEDVEAADEVTVVLEQSAPKNKSRKTKETTESDQQMMLAPDGDTSDRSLDQDGKTRLIAHAMVGMQNKLYIRGDEPWLSWDDGQVMDLVGIGEFAWSIDDLGEPIEVTLFLNDELAAEGQSIRLEPGKTIRVSPEFPSS